MNNWCSEPSLAPNIHKYLITTKNSDKIRQRSVEQKYSATPTPTCDTDSLFLLHLFKAFLLTFKYATNVLLLDLPFISSTVHACQLRYQFSLPSSLSLTIYSYFCLTRHSSTRVCRSATAPPLDPADAALAFSLYEVKTKHLLAYRAKSPLPGPSTFLSLRLPVFWKP